METLKVKQGEESANLEKRKKEIEAELSEIEPLVQKTKDAVGNIKPESLSEIRSLRIPPDVIRDILEGVLRLMGIFDVSWLSMRRYADFHHINPTRQYFLLVEQDEILKSIFNIPYCFILCCLV